jgi:hypothetical protein
MKAMIRRQNLRGRAFAAVCAVPLPGIMENIVIEANFLPKLR